MSTNGLAKNERLKLKKDILRLFETGKSTYLFPLTLRYLRVNSFTEAPVLFGVSVPKRKIKLATKRNRIKRKIREFYRTNKQDLLLHCKNHNVGYHIMFIYASQDATHIDNAERSIKELLNTLIHAAS